MPCRRKGKITINDRTIEEFFGLETLRMIVKQPLVVTNNESKYYYTVKISGDSSLTRTENEFEISEQIFTSLIDKIIPGTHLIIKDRYKFIQIDDLKPKEIYSRVEKSLKEAGYKIDSNTGYYIVNNALNNYDLAINEVEKIKLYYGKGCTVKYDDVVNIVSKNIEDNNFKFIDTVISRDIKEAFKMYDDLMIQKVEPIMLMSMLAKEVRNMLLVKKMMKSKNKKDMMEVLGLKFDFQIDKLISNSYNFSEDKLESYLVLLSDLDYKIKRGKISNKLALEMFIINICR